MKVSGSAQRRTATFLPESLEVKEKVFIFADKKHNEEKMTTTISIPVSEYNRAKAYAKERNLSIDELFVALLGQLTSRDEDAIWEKMPPTRKPYTHEELMARIDEL